MSTIAHGALTSLAFCWTLQRADGAGLALTSGDRDLSFEGMVYRASPGATPASIGRSVGLEPDSVEIAGALTADALSESDLALGRWTGSSVRLVAVDWEAPDAGQIELFSGELGAAVTEDDGYSAELHGTAAKLARPVCPRTSPECRAALGDKNCRVDLAGRTLRATVVSAQGNVLQLDSPAEDRFLFGRLRYLGGANCGLASTVLGVSGGEISLRDRPGEAVAPGTLVELREGCDKRFITCVSRFQNGANFRGEPHLPGTDLLTRYPGA